MKIKKFNQIKESSYSDFLMQYEEEIEKSIKLLVKLKDVIDTIDDASYEKIENKLSVYDTNVQSKIDEWIYKTPTSNEIADFAIMNQDKWGTEPKMLLYAIEDFADACDISLEDEDDDGFYEGSFQFDDDDENESKIDNFTAKYYDNFDDEEDKDQKYKIDLQNFEENNLQKIQLFEDFEDHYTFECSGSPKPYFSTKADFFDFMTDCGFKHTTLTKNTNMLIVESKDLGSLKCQKAQKYGIPIYTYKEAKVKVKEISQNVLNYNL